MCWEMDYYWFAEQQKAQEKQKEEQQKEEQQKEEQKQAQRAEAIDKLLSEANQQADRADETPPGKETVPAK